MRGSESWECANEGIEGALEGLVAHLSDKAVDALVVPYIAEAGLAVALEPSLLRKFEADRQHFYVDNEHDMAEPVNLVLDGYCNDRKGGTEKLARRQLSRGISAEGDSRSSGSVGSKRWNQRGSLAHSVRSAGDSYRSPGSPIKRNRLAALGAMINGAVTHEHESRLGHHGQ